MSRGYVPHLLLLAGLWGASYLFIKIAVEDISPATMMAAPHPGETHVQVGNRRNGQAAPHRPAGRREAIAGRDEIGRGLHGGMMPAGKLCP